MNDSACEIHGCERPRYQMRRLCSTHAMRKHRYGDPLVSKSRAGRTWVTSNGYEKRNEGAVHRLALREAIGAGPHSCHWCGTTVDWLPFKGSWEGVLVVDHLDGNKRNNKASNLVASCFSCNALRARWGDDAVRNRRSS